MRLKIFFPFLAFALLTLTALVNSSCGVYSFRDVSIPDTLKSVQIAPIINRAPYVNTQLATNLTDRLRRKIQNQTRLRVSNDPGADMVVNATITDYSITTSGVSNTGSSLNRLTVTVQVSVTKGRNPEAPPQEYTLSRPFDFAANKSFREAETELFEEMVRGLTDDIFNRLFSNW
ncbi:MAG: hypothetical protein EOO16_05800 [Chitinophagaceae bacterium]|nr:MAG: hypothetical protein EOO16_05800 [Chitinophagaceae bacterium]